MQQDLASLVGPQAYEQFMSPYQQQVMDATLSEFDRQQTIGQVGLRDQAIQAGAYGGGREGVMQAEYMNQGGVNRAQLQAQLLNQGFQQAQAAAAQDLAARQGLGGYQSQLGQQQQAYRTSWIRCNTNCSKRKRIPTIHTIRIDWSTTCTNSTRSIPYTNSRLCTTSSSG